MPSKKRKPTKAQLEAERSYAAMMKRWDKIPRFSSTSVPKSEVEQMLSTSDTMSAPPGRFTSNGIPSRVTPGGSTAKVQDRTYTGSAILGIATLHKSIAQPVFSKDEAEQVAKMRRN